MYMYILSFYVFFLKTERILLNAIPAENFFGLTAFK